MEKSKAYIFVNRFRGMGRDGIVRTNVATGPDYTAPRYHV